MSLLLWDCYTNIRKVVKLLISTVLGRLLLLGWFVALATSGLGFTAGVGAIVTCLFLAGACSGFCSSGLVHTHYLLSPAALQVGSMLIRQAGFVLPVVQSLLQMNSMLCRSVLLQPLRQQYAALFPPETDTYYEVLFWTDGSCAGFLFYS